MKRFFSRNSHPKPALKRGFTLIEVIIVLGIMAILAIIAFSYLNAGAMQKARDAERKDDLHEIKIAFEEYYNDNGCYPPPEILSNCGSTDLSPYMSQVPCDPATEDPYVYIPYPTTENTCSGYRVYAPIEWSGDPIIENVGCEGGCGLSEEYLSYLGIERWEPEDYQYGISEGVPVVYNEGTPAITSGWCCNSVNPGGQCLWFNNASGGCNGATYVDNTSCVNANNNCTY